jgi:hypothetical protein
MCFCVISNVTRMLEYNMRMELYISFTIKGGCMCITHSHCDTVPESQNGGVGKDGH